VKRISLTFYIFTLSGCVITWKATLQPNVALSTIEAEYMSLTKGVKQGDGTLFAKGPITRSMAKKIQENLTTSSQGEAKLLFTWAIMENF